MTRADQPRIVLDHIQGRQWAAWTQGQGTGTNWGVALAALSLHAHTITNTPTPNYHLDAEKVKELVRECVALGIPLTGGMKTR